jgi:NAD(P)-dependent dehydrogenase (short-subunit alcohol dehydrogenase family)
VAVVTGGGGGIGAAIAEELGLKGWFVATMDPLVSVDGSERLSEPAQTTADRIVAAGGSAASSQVSVTDAEGVASFFEQLARDHGGLDAVVNVAGITRPTGFAHGSDEDWRAVLEVHLDGYLNVLRAALPIMAASGHGRILGVTSGSGWRAADAGAYSCAKRAVASLTWQLGRHAPPGVTVNAISPIAATRMVAAALARAGQLGSATSASGQLGSATSASGQLGSATSAGGQPASTSARAGLSLESMPDPATLGPIACYLLSDTFAWCSATVVFAAGSEVAIVEEPRFIEVVRTGGVASLPRLLDAVIPGAFAPAEAKQLTTGGANPRFGSITPSIKPSTKPPPAPPAPPRPAGRARAPL